MAPVDDGQAAARAAAQRLLDAPAAQRLLDAPAAQRLLDAPAAQPVDAAVHPLALAWALKDACYAAWHSEPARAARAAEVLGQINTVALPPGEAQQVHGLAAWTTGLACIAGGQMAQAVAAFDGAAAFFRQAGQPDAAAQTQVPKIMALSMLGDIEQATACAQAAQAELLALGNVPAASRVSLNLGSLLLRRDAYLQASQQYRQAAVLFARQGDHLHSVLADIGLAGALSSLGDFDEALRIYARVRMRAAQQKLDYPLAVADEYVALMELARGHYGDALARLESARRRYEQLGLPHALAIAEKQLADAYLDLRLLPEALTLFEAAVAKLAALNLPEEQAAALAQRGRTQALLGRVAAARVSFDLAAALFGASSHAVGLASVTLALAELSLAQGLPAQALQQARDAAAGFAQAHHAEGLARADVIRAQALWQDGQTTAALSVFEATLKIARRRQQLQVQVRCLTGLGIAAQAAGQLQAAEHALEGAIELLEDQRSALPGEELRSAFLTEHLRPYQERLRLALDAGNAADVLVHLERYRARSLADELQAPLHGQPGEDGADAQGQAVAEGDPALRERLNWLYRRVQRLQDEDEASPLLQAELLRTEQELLERARRRRLAAPLLAGRGGAPAGAALLSVQALQAALAPGDALLEYGVLDDELFALVVTDHGVQLHRQVAHWPQVVQTLQSARFQIETLRHGVAPVQQHLASITQRTWARLQQLHGLLWVPLQASLAACTRLLVVPHGQLAALPFSALCAGRVAGPVAGSVSAPASGAWPAANAPRPLGQQLQWALVPSARAALRGLLRQSVPPRSALAVGDSLRLPHAAREVQLVARLFAQGQALVAEQATVAALHAHAGGADVLHLACHAQFRSDNPRFSALHLHDGALTVERAETLRLRTGMVVLSACESGLSEGGGGDEMVGLVRAFLVAGAARVVATLWPVDDEVTADFMAHFYRALVAGQAPALALQQAQRRLQAQHPEPYFWAAFTLYGGW